jgi:hypothetical protein
LDSEISVKFSEDKKKIIAKIFSNQVAEILVFNSIASMNVEVEKKGLHVFLSDKRGAVAWFLFLDVPKKFKGKGYGGKVVSRVFSYLKKNEIATVFCHAETVESEAICEKLGGKRLPLKDNFFWLPPFQKDL